VLQLPQHIRKRLLWHGNLVVLSQRRFEKGQHQGMRHISENFHESPECKNWQRIQQVLKLEA
jgi:hypothetical protein